jgi:hypothetical protein
MTSELVTIPQSNVPVVSIMETDGPWPQVLHSVLAQVGLPRSATAETVFTRSNGRVSVTLQAGVFFNGQRNLPSRSPSAASREADVDPCLQRGGTHQAVADRDRCAATCDSSK